MERGALIFVVLVASACANVTGLSDFDVAADDPPAPNTPPNGTTDPGAPGTSQDGGAVIDETPDLFDFADVGLAALDTDFTASAVVGGFTGILTGTVSGGGAEIRKAGGAYGSSAALAAGDTLEIHMRSSATAGDTKTAIVSLGGVGADWIVSSLPSCATANVTWKVGDAECTASSGPELGPGGKRVVTDSELTNTGSAKLTCTDGVLVPSETVCVPPTVLSVGTVTGCVNGFCIAASGQCAVPIPGNATAICVAHGFAAHTEFTTMPGPTGVNQCGATGAGCFVNQNADCNLVFQTVTCRH